MAQNLTQKILSAHLVSGELVPGSEISVRVDQTLTQDATGTMAHLQFEAMGVFIANKSQSIARSRDKLRALQILSISFFTRMRC